MRNTFSIIITSRDRVKMVTDLLSDLEKQTYKNFSVILIDDNSSDATRLLNEKVLNKKYSLTIFHSKENLKMVRARNQGIYRVNKKTDYLLILDDDNRVDSNFLEEANKFLNLYPDFGIIGLKNYYKDKKTLLNCGCNYNLSLMFPKFVKENFYNDYIFTDVVVNAFFIKNSLMQQLKEFDSNYIIDFSETEFSYRAKKHHFAVVTANIPIYHQSEGRSFYGELIRRANTRPETYFYTFRNKYLIVSEFGSFLNKVLFYGFFQFLTLLGYLYVTLKVKKLPLFKLYLEGFLAGNWYLLTHQLAIYEKKY